MPTRLWISVLVCAGGSSRAHADPDGSAAAPALATPAVVGVAETPRWPSSVLDRPLTLPGNLLLVGPDCYLSGEAGAPTHASLAATVGYGITDDLEINTIEPNYAIPLHPDASAKGKLEAGVGYKLVRGAVGGKLEVIARATGGYDAVASAALPVTIGIQAEYNFSEQLAIVSHDLGLGNAGVSVAIAGDAKPIYFTLPFGLAYQFLPALWVEADTSIIAQGELHASHTTTIADATPLELIAVLNVMDRHLDLLGYAGFGDLQHAGDTPFVGIGVRYYAGKVD